MVSVQSSLINFTFQSNTSNTVDKRFETCCINSCIFQHLFNECHSIVFPPKIYVTIFLIMWWLQVWWMWFKSCLYVHYSEALAGKNLLIPQCFPAPYNYFLVAVTLWKKNISNSLKSSNGSVEFCIITLVYD